MKSCVNFNELVAAQLRHGDDFEQVERTTRRAKTANLTAKAAVAAQSWSEAWGSPAGQGAAVEFLATIRDQSVFDTVARFATILPRDALATQVAAGASASVTDEGEPVAVSRLDVEQEELVKEKVGALIVMSDELAKTAQAYRIVQRELGNAVIAGTNEAFLGGLDTTTATAGSTALKSLQAGLDALGDCRQVVVAASYAQTRELALQADGRMGLSGGELLPGVMIIAADVSAMYVVAADRCMMEPSTLEVMPSTQASVIMSDSPQADIDAANPSATPPVLNPEPVSLFQNNLVGVRALRSLAFVGSCVKVS